MNADQDPGRSPNLSSQNYASKYHLEVNSAQGLQVGDNNFQLVIINERTVTDGVLAPALANDSGKVDSPYRGLSAFEERDKRFFFGREIATTHVLTKMSQRLSEAALIVVSGASGAGKSSLLRAGVLPRINTEGLASAPEAAFWPSLLITPHHAPLDELASCVAGLTGSDAAAVRRGLVIDPAGFALTARQAAHAALAEEKRLDSGPEPPRRLLLVIDQFEQLFTQCPDEEQRRAFIIAIHAAATIRYGQHQAPAALVMLSVRADFEARCADYPQLAEAIQDRYLVTSMTRRQLRMAITEPAKEINSSVDDDLTDLLLRDMRAHNGLISGAGVLPLLSHALDEAWRSRSGNSLKVTDYERAGGIEGAVAKSAERTYNGLSPSQQAAARQVFTRLTVTSSDGVDTSGRASRAKLAEGKTAAEVRDVEVVLEAFAAERLLTLSAGTVEISHEILLTAWPLLHDVWLAETRADRIVRTRLDNVVFEWANNSHDPTYLYGGSLLSGAIETADRIKADPDRFSSLSQAERKFLDDSIRAQRGALYRRRFLAALLVVILVGVPSAALWIYHSSQETKQERDVLASTQLIGESGALGDADPAISKLESVAAWRIHSSDNARYAMLAAAALPGIAVLRGHTGPVGSVAFSPNGETLASGSDDKTVRLWSAATGREIRHPLAVPGGQVHSVAFSPDGKTLATGDNHGIQLWDVATGSQIRPGFDFGTTKSVWSVAFSPDGKTLATRNGDGTVGLWSVASGHEIGPSIGHGLQIWSVAFSPDGKTLATGDNDGTVRLWSVATGHQAGSPLKGHTDIVVSVAFSPDGKTLASGSIDNTARLWNLTTRHQVGNPLDGDSSSVESVAFSPDGKTLASGSVDGDVWLWDVGTQLQIGHPLIGHTGSVESVAFSPDGETLASGSADGTVRLWNVGSREAGSALSSGSRQAGTSLSGDTLVNGNSLTVDRRAVAAMKFGMNGKTLTIGNADGSVRLWSVSSGRQVGNPVSGGSLTVASVAFGREGKILATGNATANIFDGSIRLWNVVTGHPIGNLLTDKGGEVESVAFSPDGKILASGDAIGSVQLWSVATGHPIGKALTNPAGGVESVAFSPDGRILASSSLDNTVRLWNVATGKQIGHPLTGDSAPIDTLAFSPDGKVLATGSTDDTARLWDVATGHQLGNPLTGNTRSVTSVAFSPDGRTLATGSSDHTVRLWDAVTGLPIANPLIGDSGDVYTVAFSPDGETLASGSLDGQVRVWNVSYLTDTALQICASAGRSLTRVEWRRYVPSGLAYQNVCPIVPGR